MAQTGKQEYPYTDVKHTSVHTNNQEIRVYQEDHTCVPNSTNIPLGINGVFTGAWQDTHGFAEIMISVGSDKASVTDGLVIQWSDDAVNVRGDDLITVAANTDKTYNYPAQRRYVKITYTNDGVAQTFFSLETTLKVHASKGSSHRLADTLDAQDDAIVTKSLVAGKTTAGGGAIVDVKVNPSGALTVESSVVSMPYATTPTLYNLTLTSANTEYSQLLPDNTKQVIFKCQTLFDIRYAYVTGKVATPTAPYRTLGAGLSLSIDQIDFDTKTLFFASSTAGVVVEVEVLT